MKIALDLLNLRKLMKLCYEGQCRNTITCMGRDEQS